MKLIKEIYISAPEALALGCDGGTRAGNYLLKAKLSTDYMSNSKKLTGVHISPVFIENIDDNGSQYRMEYSNAGALGVRLRFTKPYSSNQLKAIAGEIRTLAKAKLDNIQSVNDPLLAPFARMLEILQHHQF
jgi:hypothetical protein